MIRWRCGDRSMWCLLTEDGGGHAVVSQKESDFLHSLIALLNEAMAALALLLDSRLMLRLLNCTALAKGSSPSSMAVDSKDNEDGCSCLCTTPINFVYFCASDVAKNGNLVSIDWPIDWSIGLPWPSLAQIGLAAFWTTTTSQGLIQLQLQLPCFSALQYVNPVKWKREEPFQESSSSAPPPSGGCAVNVDGWRVLWFATASAIRLKLLQWHWRLQSINVRFRMAKNKGNTREDWRLLASWGTLCMCRVWGIDLAVHTALWCVVNC